MVYKARCYTLRNDNQEVKDILVLKLLGTRGRD